MSFPPGYSQSPLLKSENSQDMPRNLNEIVRSYVHSASNCLYFCWRFRSQLCCYCSTRSIRSIRGSSSLKPIPRCTLRYKPFALQSCYALFLRQKSQSMGGRSPYALAKSDKNKSFKQVPWVE